MGASWSTLGWAFLALSLAAACATDVDAEGAGKACDSSGRCAAGFVCELASNRCVHPNGALDGAPPDGHDSASDAGNTPDSPASGDAAVIDAGVDVTFDAHCDSPITYYLDQDGDGFGRDDVAEPSCQPPGAGWSELGGDCADQEPKAFPGQDQHFDSGYALGGGKVSFDFDCDDVESGDPTQFGSAPNCGGLALGNCNGKGFAPTARTEPGENPICGSSTLIECKSQQLSCTTQAAGTTQPKRCR